MLHLKHISLVWKLKKKMNECRCKKMRMRLKKRFHPIILQLNIDSILVLFSRFHIGEYVCPLFTVNCRVFKFPSKMQAETGQIGNRLKLTKKAKNDFESFTSHAHAKITKKQLENTYKSYCLPFIKNIRVFSPT